MSASLLFVLSVVVFIVLGWIVYELFRNLLKAIAIVAFLLFVIIVISVILHGFTIAHEAVIMSFDYEFTHLLSIIHNSPLAPSV